MLWLVWHGCLRGLVIGAKLGADIRGASEERDGYFTRWHPVARETVYR